MFQNELGRYQDFAESYGLKHDEVETAATFADYDNDGFLDLFISLKDGALLYHNAGKGKFVNATSRADLSVHRGGLSPLFADLDHDGDLDLFQAADGENQVFINTGERSFKEAENQMGLGGESDVRTTRSVFGDFDDDGDLDLYLLAVK